VRLRDIVALWQDKLVHKSTQLLSHYPFLAGQWLSMLEILANKQTSHIDEGVR
jgi:hypothetical protein